MTQPPQADLKSDAGGLRLRFNICWASEHKPPMPTLTSPPLEKNRHQYALLLNILSHSMAILCKTVYVVVLNYEWDITNTLKCDVD